MSRNSLTLYLSRYPLDFQFGNVLKALKHFHCNNNRMIIFRPRTQLP